MKLNYNRLCTLAQYATQAIKTTTKTTTLCLLSLSLSLSVTNGFAQCSPKSNPMLHTDRCRTTSNGQPASSGTFNETIMDVLSAMGGTSANCYQTPGDKNISKKRSVFVNGMLNDAGYFGYVEKDYFNNSTTATYYTNPNQEGNIFALDIDGDCTYEREDTFINWLLANDFDEINLYNVYDILEKANRDIVSVTASEINQLSSQADKGWSPPVGNTMMAIEKAEYHLFRFVHTVKSNGIDVNFILEGQKVEADAEMFYEFNADAGGEDPQWPLNEICQQYLEVAFPGIGKRSGNDEILEYITYKDAPILVLPKDSLDRISTLDKALIDIYNMKVFNMRASAGLITPGSNPCPNSPVSGGCSSTFDAILFENEWWDDQITNHDATLNQLEEVVKFARCFANDNYSSCEPKIYGTADYFHDNGWSNQIYTEQERANKVDGMFDRIYLYSYHSSPCDCYNGTQSSIEKKFWHKLDLLRNNGRGGVIDPISGTKESDIYPVFSAEFFETDISSVKYYTKPRYYDNSTGVETIGCNGSSSKCDYCTDYSGRFMNELNSSLNNLGSQSCPTTPGKRLGYVENIFQHQYDLDPTTSQSAPYGENHINGYSWLKSATLQDNNVSGKKATSVGLEDNEQPRIQVYPVPANDVLNIEYDDHVVRELLIYDVQGNVVFYLNGFDNSINIEKLNSGNYFLSIINQDYTIETIKFIKQ